MRVEKIGGRYRVERELGRGGMGVVFLAREKGRREPVALKVLTREYSGPALRHFEEEFRTLTGLRHPSLTEVYDFGRTEHPDVGGQVPFFTMEFVDGEPLDRVLRPEAIDETTVYRLLAQIAEALDYLHGQGLVHQDVKPSNVLVEKGPERRVKLMDLGLAGRPYVGRGPGKVRGTAAYLAPEVVRGDHVDARADLYSLGCVAYELLTGRPPFQGTSTLGILRRHVYEEPIPPSTLNRAVPAALESIVLKLLAKDPGLRYGGAAVLLRALNEAAGGRLAIETAESRRDRVLGGGFAGREPELARLAGFLEETRQGARRTVLVFGDAGIGKSRLLREFQVRCQLEGVAFHVGRPEEASGAGGPVVGALGSAIATLDDLSEEVRTRHGNALAALLWDSPSGEAGPDGYGLFEAAAAAVCDLGAKGPVVLAFEDLHAADPFSMALVSHLARDAAESVREGLRVPVLLLGTYRAEEVSRASPLFELLSRARQSEAIEEIHLGPLGADESRAMLRSMLGTEDIPDEFARRMFEETRGNPLHLTELTAHLAEEGYLRPGSGQAPRAETLEGVRLPRRMRSLMERRVERVPEESATVLRAAAILGEGAADPDAVAAITGLRWEHVVSRFRDLSDHGLFVREEDESGSPVYRPAHRGIAELAVEGMDPEQARELHARAVSYLERRGVARRHAAWCNLARHAESGGLPGRAIEAYTRAGDLARELHASREAVQAYTRAVELAHRHEGSSTALMCGLYRRRGDVRLQTGDVAGAEEDYRWMLARAEKGEDPELRAEALLALGRALALRNEDDEALEHFELAVEAARGRKLPELSAAARVSAARVATRRGRHDEAADLLDGALREAPEGSAVRIEAAVARGELHRARGEYAASLESFAEAEARGGDRIPAALEASILEGSALALEVQGDYRRALEVLERARKRAGRRGDTPARARLATAAAVVQIKTGDYAAAAQRLDEAEVLHRRIGSDEGRVEVYRHRAAMNSYRGRHETAREEADEALRVARRLGRKEAVAACLERLAAIEIALGDLDAASRNLEEARRALPEGSHPRRQASLRLGLGDLSRLSERIDDARRQYQESAFLARKTGDRRLESAALARLGEAHLAENAFDRATIACRKALAMVEGSGLRGPEAEAMLLRARIELTRPGGDVVQAESDALRAADTFRALGEPERLWRAEHLAGRAELRLGRRGDAVERIGKAYRYVEKARARLGERARETFLRDAARRELYDDWDRLRTPVPLSSGEVSEEARGEFARLQRENASLRRLLEINRTLNSTRDTGDLLRRILESALELTGADRGLLLLDEGHEVSTGGGADADSIEPGRIVARGTMESGEPLLCPNAASDERFASHDDLHALGVRSVLAVPLRIQKAVAGALYLDRRADEGRFDEDDLDLAARLADQAALALDTSAMLAKIDSQRAHLERLNRELEQTVAAQRDEIAQVRDSMVSSRTSFELRYRFDDLIGASRAMQKVYYLIEKLAPTRLPVLILGESGTGKELIARALHRRSDRGDGPFFTVNCAALTESLLESELFGHKKGSFTGADRDKPGFFELASGGTLFLDEIGEMGAAMQAKVLRAIERGEILPVGGKAPAKVDVRAIAATHRDLRAMIREGAFREDLFYRINVGRIEVPPLRERREDIPLLVDHFLAVLAEDQGTPKLEVEPAALRRMAQYDWPGNVRELQHQILRTSTFAKGSVLTLKYFERFSDLPDRAPGGGPGSDAEDSSGVESLEETEKKQILRALEEAGGNKTRAAELLGINRATLFRKLKRLRLQA